FFLLPSNSVRSGHVLIIPTYLYRSIKEYRSNRGKRPLRNDFLRSGPGTLGPPAREARGRGCGNGEAGAGAVGDVVEQCQACSRRVTEVDDVEGRWALIQVVAVTPGVETE